MSKTFMDEVREAETGAGNPDNWPDYWELCEKLIAIDDLITKYNAVDKEVCGIGMLGKLHLVGDIKQILEQTIDKQE